ncbi:hypothetical protein BUALT_Bualt13G0079500 [Buddleja alternifolia]|uniref:Uncharacterized protein n=1 Tax=Buddleja alternifolia TaxID=168488 RepID=A0AAV6WU44_9LAMI|nr:hypothetical protein BUALT_Bualt13G0079500 [Buddleja alternifolia]
MHPPNPMMCPAHVNAPNAAGVGSTHLQQHPFPPFYEQQHPHSRPLVGHSLPEFDQPYRPFKGLSRPLPSDIEMELNGVLNNLTGTKESIKGKFDRLKYSFFNNFSIKILNIVCPWANVSTYVIASASSGYMLTSCCAFAIFGGEMLMISKTCEI